MHINITYIVTVLMTQKVSVLWHQLQGVAASFLNTTLCGVHKIFTLKA